MRDKIPGPCSKAQLVHYSYLIYLTKNLHNIFKMNGIRRYENKYSRISDTKASQYLLIFFKEFQITISVVP